MTDEPGQHEQGQHEQGPQPQGRLDGLTCLSGRLAAAAGTRDVLRVVLADAPGVLGASSCRVLLPGAGDTWLANRDPSVRSMRASSWDEVRLEPDGPEASAIASGRPVLPVRHAGIGGPDAGVDVFTGAVPVLDRRGAVLAVLTFRWEDATQAPDGSWERFEVVGALCGESVQRGVALDRERSARLRATVLQRATLALARARRSDEVVDAVARHGARLLGVRRVRLVLDADVAERGVPVAVDGMPVARLVLEREASDALRSRLPIDRSHDPRAAEGPVLLAFVELCAQALDRCRLADREHRIAVELQRAMLGRPDAVDDLRTGMVYLPGESELEVGGDWADVVRMPGGRIALVVGDVVGHSIEAAAAMGQLRSAVRSLLSVCPTLPVLLERVDAFAASVDNAEATTLAVLVIDPSDGRFHYVCAGHPPVVHRRADGTVALLEEGRNAPLGCATRRTVAVGSGELGAGELLLLYTDGLVERRDRTLDEGLTRLCEVLGHLEPDVELAAALGTDLSDPARWLASSMLEGEVADDDVCLLLVAPVLRAGFHRRIRAATHSLADVRRALRGWCASQGLDEAHIADVLVVAGEALANAVEHAYAGREAGPVSIDATLDADRAVVLRVSDQGAWRRPFAAGLRGHGTRIMRTVSSRFEVDRLPTGTIVRATVPPGASVPPDVDRSR